MVNFIVDNFRKGLARLRESPQLIYTLVVAVVILAAFIFITTRFTSLAKEAQDQLINVRIGSVQDAFAEFAADYVNDPARLEEVITNLSHANETVKVFAVVSFASTTPRIIAALDQSSIGRDDLLHDFLYGLAKNDPAHSFTQEGARTEGRVFETVRAIRDSGGNVIGALYTEQSLSEADRRIESNIQASLALFVVIMALVMLLFFHHSRIIDYTALYRKLREVDELKDDFIAMASHELRTPLTAIRGYAEFAGEETDPKKKAEYIEAIARSSKDLAFLVSDMLDVSRIEQGRMTLSPKPVSLAEAVTALTRELETLARAKNLAYAVETTDGLPMISADPDRLRQILVNVAGNAIKYTEKGEVRVRVYSEGSRVVVRVSDTGIGIPAEGQKRLFEKFYRVQGEATRGITGTGLGLWIVKQLVEKMGGTVAIESISGVGTHFIISFPALTAETAPVPGAR